MRRKQATALIDKVRMLVAEAGAGHTSPVYALHRLASELDGAGLKPLEACHGEAHSNAYIDNCSLCAPRWGWVGPVEVVS